MGNVAEDAWRSSKSGAFQWRVGQLERRDSTLNIIVLKWERSVYEMMNVGADYATHVALVSSEKPFPFEGRIPLIPIPKARLNFIPTSHLKRALSVINHKGFVESHLMLDFLDVYPAYLPPHEPLCEPHLHETDVENMLEAIGITDYQNRNRFVFWDENDSMLLNLDSQTNPSRQEVLPQGATVLPPGERVGWLRRRDDSLHTEQLRRLREFYATGDRLKYVHSRSIDGVQGRLWIAPTLHFATVITKRRRRGFTCMGNPARNYSCVSNRLSIDFKMIWRIAAETYIHRRPFLYGDYSLILSARNFPLDNVRRDTEGQLHTTLPGKTALASPPISRATPWCVTWHPDFFLIEHEPQTSSMPSPGYIVDENNDWHFHGESDFLWHLFGTDNVRQGLLRGPLCVSAKATCEACGAMFRVVIPVNLNRELPDARCSCDSFHIKSWEEGGTTIRHCGQCQTIFGDINKYKPGP